MRTSYILCAMLACAPLTIQARAIASSEDGHSPAAAADVGEAAGLTAPSRDANTKAGRTRGRGSKQTGAQTGSGSKGRDTVVVASSRRGSVTPQSGVAQAGRSNADRLHSLLTAQARGRLARQPGRVGSSRAATHGSDDVRGPQGVSPAGRPKLAASNGPASPAVVPAGQSKLAASNSAAAMPAGEPKLTASKGAAPPAARLSSTPRSAVIGGPHAQGLGRVGGPAISRATHSATIDGTQQRHKF